MAEYVVTPWEVSGKIDYKKLIKEFGTQPLTDLIIKRIEKHAGNSIEIVSPAPTPLGVVN